MPLFCNEQIGKKYVPKKGVYRRAASLLGSDHIPTLKLFGLKNTRRRIYFFVLDTKNFVVGLFFKTPTVYLNHPTKIMTLLVAGTK